MGFFQKNVNVFLMLVILMSVIAFAAATIFYQSTFQEITAESHNISGSYSQCVAQLENTKQQLQRTSDILNSTEQDIRRYDELYATKTSELEDTTEDLESAKTDLAKYTSWYTEQKNRADALSDEVTRLTDLKNQLTAENNQLRLEVADLEDQIDDLQADLDACESP